MDEQIRSMIEESINIKKEVHKIIPDIKKVIELLTTSLKNKNKAIFCGNGGSAADAQHLSAELLGKIGQYENPLPAIALTTNSSTVTAIANDFGFDEIFSRQLQGLMEKDDLLFLISTSGNSKNLIEAAKEGKKLGGIIIGLLGNDGGDLKKFCDFTIVIPSKNTQRIQESHIMVGHIICELVKSRL